MIEEKKRHVVNSLFENVELLILISDNCIGVSFQRRLREPPLLFASSFIVSCHFHARRQVEVLHRSAVFVFSSSLRLISSLQHRARANYFTFQFSIQCLASRDNSIL
ncbi:hypothetical protein Q3G72_001234 [Acer saccharum]|nr:hypothetical protein Q3G72_001234 [Acer saccharum]